MEPDFPRATLNNLHNLVVHRLPPSAQRLAVLVQIPVKLQHDWCGKGDVRIVGVDGVQHIPVAGDLLL